MSGDNLAMVTPARLAALEQKAAERDTCYQIIKNVASIGQRDRSGLVLSALGFDLLDTRWRIGYDGWERQGDFAQAGCFPATDWIDELLAALPERDGTEGTE